MLASHFPAGRVQAPSPSKVVSYTIFGDRKTIPLLRRMQDENVVQLLGILNSRLGSFFFFSSCFPCPSCLRRLFSAMMFTTLHY